MEATMNTLDVTKTSMEDEVKILDLIKFTPDLEDYIKVYVFNNIDRPQNIIEERFSI